ncbi:MAG: quinone-dependent dihydroorotate dehydrogenase [Alphaproteobacteria bacterium]
MIYRLLRPLIFKIDAELAHNSAINFLKYLPRFASLFALDKDYANLKTRVFNFDFKSPIGMSAGFDKNCQVVDVLEKFGFGFIEAGTTTPRAQIGNEKPRIFRLVEDQAIINRLGFNNLGSEVFLKNLQIIKPKTKKIIGVNIGKNKDTVDPNSDYLELIKKFYHLADYLTINISSPNTKNLRDLQNEKLLLNLLNDVDSLKVELSEKTQKNTAILLKIAPDLDFEQQQQIADIVVNSQISGLIISNTTISRPQNLKSNFAQELGGLSGKPLFDKSNEVLRNFYKLTQGKIPLIGVGGIASAEDVYLKIRSGASLVQIYSAFVYQGLGLVEKIKKDLSLLIAKEGFKNIEEIVGIDSK